ncbi:acyltransferase family protein [Mastigocoleus testarum]|uniref:Acyltransferase 3 domain-containing protein n=1 Tax=Mastigocoleus testarum BC008 TaxID=371196 RepID=A0A0V7ZV66_9CYAN|nr:acyltransferase family protein [Mastigocoleus testarum]KST68541.1 hypothetical protein BC008_01355 [Mastigocoleus testarum BC008]KST68556.1 hypothetical protein BC008_01430 [Mastigocoleus testarum BC008]
MNQESVLNLGVSKPVRRYDFDSLKVMGTFAVFIFHCLRFFDLGAWHVKNNELNAIASISAIILLQWIMPLFFVLSGASIYFALRFRTPRQFVQERCMRLLIPLVFGIFILSPPQVYLERLTNPRHGVASWDGGLQFSGSFWDFIPYYFQGFYLFGGNFAWMGMHLWYLLVLFLFSLLFLPLFIYFKQGKGEKLIGTVVKILEKPMVIFLLGLPIALLETTLNPTTLGFRTAGGWNLFSYVVFLLGGYFIVTEQRIEQAVDQNFIPALVFAVFTTLLLLQPDLNQLMRDKNYGSWGYTLMITLRSFNSWFWIVAFLGMGRKFLSFSSPTLRYLSEASLPFYMLHQTIIVLIGFIIATWEIGIFAKFIVLSSFTLTAIAFLYELLIRRIGLLRFFFGLKPT